MELPRADHRVDYRGSPDQSASGNRQNGTDRQIQFRLTFADDPRPGTTPAPDAERTPTLADAIERLGCRLVDTKDPIEVLVVDKVNREPIEN
jgi:uncharacterized protein (TIGR03435 family)